MKKVFDYDSLTYMRIKEWPGMFRCIGSSPYSQYYIKGKIGYITDEYNSLEFDINRRVCHFINKARTKTVFISSSSKLPRDLVRNTYAITRDENKADVTVIPFLKKYMSERGNVIAYYPESKQLFVVNVLRTRDRTSYNEEELKLLYEAIAQGAALEKEKMEFYVINDRLKMFSLYIVSNVKEYRDILENKYPSITYIFDTELPFKAQNNISIETLDLWRRIPFSDRDFFKKSVLSSDYQDYPITMCFFLQYEITYAYDFASDPQFQIVTNTIGYDAYRKDGISADMVNLDVSPKDWNMLSSWVLHSIGIDDKDYGFITLDQWDKLRSSYQKILKCRMAVAKQPLEEPASLATILNRAK